MLRELMLDGQAFSESVTNAFKPFADEADHQKSLRLEWIVMGLVEMFLLRLGR